MRRVTLAARLKKSVKPKSKAMANKVHKSSRLMCSQARALANRTATSKAMTVSRSLR